MPISYKHKCVFIHIPKTGGTTVEKLLDINPDPVENIKSYWALDNLQIAYYIKEFNCKTSFFLQHLPAIFIKNFNPETFNNFFKFSIVRNPYDRLISEFCWLNRNELKIDNYYFINNFKAWVNNLTPKTFNNHTLPQYYFLYNKNTLLVDKVYKYEDLQNALKELSVKLNFELKDIWLHKNNFDIDKEALLPTNIKEKIYKLYEKDFIVFNYPE